MGRMTVLFMVLLSIGAAARAQTDDAKSPKQALLAQDAAAHSGSVEADQQFYLAKSEHQEKLSKAIAAGDVALANLQSAVGRQFGPDLATAVVHAAGTVVAQDIEAATEKVDAEQATVEFKDDVLPLHMVRIDGAWKVSLPDMLGEATIPQVDKLTAKLTEFTQELSRLTDLVAKQKFRSGEGVRDRVKALHDRLFKPAPPDDAAGQGV